MENISKALIIAGGILITLLILSLLVFLFNRISIIPQEQSQQYSELEIIEYNRSYEVYQKPLMYGTDIISIVNKAIDHNMRNGLLNENSNFFSKAFVNTINGNMMSIETEFKSKVDELDFFTRVRIYYLTRDENGNLREKEYITNQTIPGKNNKKIGDVLEGKSYENLLNSTGVNLIDKKFVPHEYKYEFKDAKDFFDIKSGNIKLIAGDADQDINANKSLMKFLEAEPITVLNPDPEDKTWSRLVVTPASAKLKRLIFKANMEKTEYYQNGRIRKMYFEEI